MRDAYAADERFSPPLMPFPVLDPTRVNSSVRSIVAGTRRETGGLPRLVGSVHGMP